MHRVTTEFRPLTKDDVADVLGVSLRTVENWVNDGTLVAPGKIGNRVYWHPRTFYEWLDRTLTAAAGCTPVAGPTQGTCTPEALYVSCTAQSKTTKGAKGEADALRSRGEAKLKALLA
jgi:predicted DNA-binding transcriptional regulator AlpA